MRTVVVGELAQSLGQLTFILSWPDDGEKPKHVANFNNKVNK
jgi:hypothetical protein